MKHKNYITFISIISLFFIWGCSGSKRFTNDNRTIKYSPSTPSPNIKVFLDDKSQNLTFRVSNNVILSSMGKNIAVVNEGNKLIFNSEEGELKLSIGDKEFNSSYFSIKPKDNNSFINYRGKRYRGSLRFVIGNNKIMVINVLPIEDYLKGVLPLEMPIGKGNENNEALKAMAVAARTYSFNRMNKNNKTFDVYLDVRDQVYGGVKAEKALTNKMIDETNGQILTYDDKPALVFYSASGGGYTENAKNIFGNKYDVPYLRGVKDGDKPYDSIMPNFEWTEKYTEGQFLSMLLNAGKINNVNYSIEDIKIESRFSSGRVNELKIDLESVDNDDKEIVLKGNPIRSVIRRVNGGILRSTMIDIEMDDDNIIISGKGNGHGVGLSQWGAIYLSHNGTEYKKILSHYFPGTEIEPISYEK